MSETTWDCRLKDGKPCPQNYVPFKRVRGFRKHMLDDHNIALDDDAATDEYKVTKAAGDPPAPAAHPGPRKPVLFGIAPSAPSKGTPKRKGSPTLPRTRSNAKKAKVAPGSDAGSVEMGDDEEEEEDIEVPEMDVSDDDQGSVVAAGDAKGKGKATAGPVGSVGARGAAKRVDAAMVKALGIDQNQHDKWTTPGPRPRTVISSGAVASPVCHLFLGRDPLPSPNQQQADDEARLAAAVPRPNRFAGRALPSDRPADQTDDADWKMLSDLLRSDRPAQATPYVVMSPDLAVGTNPAGYRHPATCTASYDDLAGAATTPHADKTEAAYPNVRAPASESVGEVFVYVPDAPAITTPGSSSLRFYCVQCLPEDDFDIIKAAGRDEETAYALKGFDKLSIKEKFQTRAALDFLTAGQELDALGL